MKKYNFAHFFSQPKGKRKASRGFTFIELLVVIVLIGVISTIAMVSYVSTSASTRDARRKKDLAALQASLEIYKVNTGSYPAHSTCGLTGTWPGCVTPWIPGLDSNYISEMPVDPKQNTTSFIGNTSDPTYTYNYYRPTTTSYFLLTRLENENDSDINGSSYGYTGDNIYVVTEPK